MSSSGDLSRQLEPLAEKVQALTGPAPTTFDTGTPALLRLAPLAGETLHLAAYLLGNADHGRTDSARYNLQILHDVAERLVATTREALGDYDGDVPRLHGRCLASVQLDDAERQWLAFRPYRANEVPAELTCELEAGHPDPHAACGQLGNGVEWWKHWTLRAGEITQHRPCGAEIPNTDPNDKLNETEVCLLYADHPGRHSFHIGR
jgi:hypothetical protein